ncbi:MAG: hypothetical protein KF699_11470 [Phycisphaeraceae bacterium]|nr:hypothetical protein [Phycisphaeraceae bacterium]
MPLPSARNPNINHERAAHAAVMAAVCAAGVFLVFASPLILSQNLLGRGAFDQIHFHEPVVRTFAEQLSRGWSALDVRDYRSATTPGYHLLLAMVARYVHPSPMLLQAIGSLFTAALLALLAGGATALAARRGALRPARLGLVLVIPAMASMYVLFPGVWLLPDNLGWLLVLSIGLVALQLIGSPIRSIAGRAGLLALGGTLLLALVLVRQSHLWAAAMLWAAAWIGGAPGDRVLHDLAQRGRAALLALLATLPAFVAVGAFALLWGGLTPPSFRDQYGGGINPAAPAFILSLAAVFSIFFAGTIGPAAVMLLRTSPRLVIVAATFGLALAAAPETTFIYEARATGLWNLVKVAPVIAERTSLLLLVLAPLGAAALCAWAAALPFRERWLFLAALAAFAAAQTASPLCWQRYVEPFLLGLFALGAATIVDAPGRAVAAARWGGPALLGAACALLTAAMLHRAEIPPDTEPTPDGRRKVRELPAAPDRPAPPPAD